MSLPPVNEMVLIGQSVKFIVTGIKKDGLSNQWLADTPLSVTASHTNLDKGIWINFVKTGEFPFHIETSVDYDPFIAVINAIEQCQMVGQWSMTPRSLDADLNEFDVIFTFSNAYDYSMIQAILN